MLVKQLIGRYAGEVRNMAPRVARQLIASGRALDVRSEAVAAVNPPEHPTTGAQITSVSTSASLIRAGEALMERTKQRQDAAGKPRGRKRTKEEFVELLDKPLRRPNRTRPLS